MVRKSVLFAAMLVLTFSSGALAKNSGKGVKCGDSTIAAGKTCHKPAPSPAPMCKTGKACGGACIAKDKQCHLKP